MAFVDTRACPGQVLRGGNNLLDKVEQLEAAAAKQEHKLQQQRVQQEEQERRIAELEEVSLMLEGKYSSKQARWQRCGRGHRGDQSLRAWGESAMHHRTGYVSSFKPDGPHFGSAGSVPGIGAEEQAAKVW